MATVVVTKFREFTDVIMTLPVIYSACRSNVETDFVLITRASLTSLFVNRPANLHVEGQDLPRYKGFFLLRRLWRNIKESFNPSFLVCLDNGKEPRMLSFIARLGGCKTSVVREAPNHRKLIRRNNKVMLPLQSARAR